MEVTVSIPDKFIPVAGVGGDISRQMLEAYAIENYRQEKMSLGQLAELLDLSLDEANAFLKKRNIPLNYGLDDLDEDLRAVETILNK
jgi:predicted HTH domain antitoxin